MKCTFQCTQFSSCHSLTVEEAFITEQTFRLLRTNSVKEKFESIRRYFNFRLLERSYPEKLVNKIEAEVDFSSQNTAWKYKPMTFQKHSTVCHHLAYNPGVPKLNEIVTIIHVSLLMPPLSVTGRIKSLYRKNKSIKHVLVRANLLVTPKP